eukprot:m.118847 g.118847  ORF g.118847 m.118847 type:complete len:619 (-) comp14521_c0_seq1:21-1877(-)
MGKPKTRDSSGPKPLIGKWNNVLLFSSVFLCLAVGLMLFESRFDENKAQNSTVAPNNASSAPHNATTEAGSGITRLMRAARIGHLPAVQALLAVEDVSAQDARGMTLVHYALEGRHHTILDSLAGLRGEHERIIELVVQHNASAAAISCPLYYAVHYRNIRAIRALLKTPDPRACLILPDAFNETALHAAAWGKASGFARLFVRARKTPSAPALPQILELLGLTAIPEDSLPPGPDGSMLTSAAMTKAISSIDLELILPFLRPEDLELATPRGHTALHLAARDGRDDAVRILCQADAKIEPRNIYGHTPLELAMLSGHCSTIQVLRSLGATCPTTMTSLCTEELRQTGCEPIAPLPPQSMHEPNFVEGLGGWDDPDGSIVDSPGCDFDVIDATTATEETLSSTYLVPGRPVLLRAAATRRSAHAWHRHNFLRQFGDLPVNVGTVPYASTYNVSAPKKMTISDYALAVRQPGSQPLYVFDANVLWHNTTLYEQLPRPAWLTAPEILRQFMLGPTGSGAPPHFHGPAINILAHGVKDWVLYPPAHAFFSTSHVSVWQSEFNAQPVPSSQSSSLASGPHSVAKHALRCRQHAGDTLFVPAAWGHAVINRKFVVAVAYEFRM